MWDVVAGYFQSWCLYEFVTVAHSSQPAMSSGHSTTMLSLETNCYWKGPANHPKKGTRKMEKLLLNECKKEWEVALQKNCQLPHS